MKSFALTATFVCIFQFFSSACSVNVNDSLLTNYNLVLNAINVTGQAPFQFNWTVKDGNGVNLPFTQNTYGDSITINAIDIQNAYGCVVYQLCVTDALGCMTCAADTNLYQVPFACYSAFSSSILGSNQISITVNNNIPPFLIQQQMMNWTDGNGQGQSAPYLGAGSIITYTPGPQNTSSQFYLCVMSILSTGGCISCDSIPYIVLNVSEQERSFNMYPNPVNDMLTISNNQSFTSIKILSLTGETIEKQEIKESSQNFQLSTRSLSDGIYIVQLENGDIRVQKKITVQH
jgi:hypothetical protein